MPQLHARVGPEPLARLAACAVLVAFGWSAGAAETQRPPRVRLPEPPPEAAPDELFNYVEDIADPALEPESRGRLRYHRRKVAALTVAAADLILSQVPEDDPRHVAGKVVLIDFWATWCGPCVAEIPRVRDAYDRYHERGFEVVGISLDEDRDALEAFVAEKQIPWPIILDARNDAGGLAARYGINAIPTMILVGRDGTVVSTDARGPRLEELLAEQFPMP